MCDSDPDNNLAHFILFFMKSIIPIVSPKSPRLLAQAVNILLTKNVLYSDLWTVLYIDLWIIQKNDFQSLTEPQSIR